MHYLHAADEGTACLLLAAAVDDDDELVFLAALGLASRPAGYLPRFRFNIKNLDNDDCMHMFRFTPFDIVRLQAALKVPDEVKGSNGTVDRWTDGRTDESRNAAY